MSLCFEVVIVGCCFVILNPLSAEKNRLMGFLMVHGKDFLTFALNGLKCFY